MPAEGAMQTRLEAPAQEPRNVPDPDGEIHLADVSRAFARRGAPPVPALAGVSLDVAAGETVAVVGPSGCGKTTLLELVCGLQAPDSGSVRAAPAVLMPQRDLLLPWLSAIDNAALALRVAGVRRAEAPERAHPLFPAVGLGVLASLVLGFALAVALHFSRVLRRGAYPLLVASQAVPIVIVAPLLVVWFGFGIVPKLAIIALVCFFPVVVTTLDALGNVDPDQLKLLRTLDASRWQAFRYAEAPAALPAALSGAKIAVAVAVIGAVFAEYAGSSSGLGHLMLQAIPQLETARAYAAVVLLAAFAIALFSALALAERRLVPWAHRRPEGPNRR